MTLDDVCSYLVGLGSYLPSTIVRNDAFEGKKLKKFRPDGTVEKEVVCTEEWIVQNMGVRERRRAKRAETVPYMGSQAAGAALADARLSLTETNGILVGTVTSPHVFPSAACEIQHLLRSSPGGREVLAVDVSAACTGYLVCLDLADSYLRARKADALVVVGVEKLSDIVDPEDANAPLFGDGAGAGVIVSDYVLKRPFSPRGRLAGGIVATYVQSECTGENLMAIHRDTKRFLRMFEGNKVMRYATRSMVEAVRCIKEKTGWTNDDIDLVIPHQANIRILEAVARVSHLPMEKIYVNIDRYGNMSSATCAVAHWEAFHEGRIREGSKVILTAFGSGYVTGAVGLEYCLV